MPAPSMAATAFFTQISIDRASLRHGITTETCTTDGTGQFGALVDDEDEGSVGASVVGSVDATTGRTVFSATKLSNRALGSLPALPTIPTNEASSRSVSITENTSLPFIWIEMRSPANVTATVVPSAAALSPVLPTETD